MAVMRYGVEKLVLRCSEGLLKQPLSGLRTPSCPPKGEYDAGITEVKYEI